MRCRTQFSSSTVTLCTTVSCSFMLTPCGRQPIKFITIQLVWHWPVFSNRTVVTTAELSMSKVCNFNITHEMLKYGVLVGNTGHFDNEIAWQSPSWSDSTVKGPQ